MGNTRGFRATPQVEYVPSMNAGPVVVGSVLCVAPSDSAVLYGLDVRNGETRWKIPRDEVQTILGGVDGTLYLSGKEVWWVDVLTGQVRKWSNEGLVYAGEGFVTEDALFVPTSEWIYRFDRKSAKLSGKIKLSAERKEAGNLLLVDGRFFSVTADRIHTFDVWTKAESDLKASIRAHPKDPLAYERLGQGLARKEQWLAAIEQYRTSLRCFGERSRAQDAESIRKVRRIVYGLYDRATQENLSKQAYKPGLGLSQEMLKFAHDQRSGIRARLRVMAFQRALSLWSDVAAGLQVFIERSPDVLHDFDGDTEMAAGLYAELELTKLIHQHGRECYARFDR